MDDGIGGRKIKAGSSRLEAQEKERSFARLKSFNGDRAILCVARQRDEGDICFAKLCLN
jgi:hypothetical protein